MPTVSAQTPATSTYSCLHQFSLFEKNVKEKRRVAECIQVQHPRLKPLLLLARSCHLRGLTAQSLKQNKSQGRALQHFAEHYVYITFNSFQQISALHTMRYTLIKKYIEFKESWLGLVDFFQQQDSIDSLFFPSPYKANIKFILDDTKDRPMKGHSQKNFSQKKLHNIMLSLYIQESFIH